MRDDPPRSDPWPASRGGSRRGDGQRAGAAALAHAKPAPTTTATTTPGRARQARGVSRRASRRSSGGTRHRRRPIANDAAGRPMLRSATVNRGESLSLPVDGDDGGFASADLDRAAHLLRAAGGRRASDRSAHARARLPHPDALRRAGDPRRLRLPRAQARLALESRQGPRGRHRRAGRRRRGRRPLRARDRLRRRGRLPDEPVRARRRPPAELLLGRLQRPADEKPRARHPRRPRRAERRGRPGARAVADRAVPASPTDVDAALRARGLVVASRSRTTTRTTRTEPAGRPPARRRERAKLTETWTPTSRGSCTRSGCVEAAALASERGDARVASELFERACDWASASARGAEGGRRGEGARAGGAGRRRRGRRARDRPRRSPRGQRGRMRAAPRPPGARPLGRAAAGGDGPHAGGGALVGTRGRGPARGASRRRERRSRGRGTDARGGASPPAAGVGRGGRAGDCSSRVSASTRRRYARSSASRRTCPSAGEALVHLASSLARSACSGRRPTRPRSSRRRAGRPARRHSRADCASRPSRRGAPAALRPLRRRARGRIVPQRARRRVRRRRAVRARRRQDLRRVGRAGRRTRRARAVRARGAVRCARSTIRTSCRCASTCRRGRRSSSAGCAGGTLERCSRPPARSRPRAPWRSRAPSWPRSARRIGSASSTATSNRRTSSSTTPASRASATSASRTSAISRRRRPRASSGRSRT